MVLIVPITAKNVQTFKKVRLEALQDTPTAFGSTYARERELADSDWLKRVENWSGERGIGFLAMAGDNACGLAGSFLDQENASRAQLISMWTAPEYRRQGVGRLLVSAAAEWARSKGCTALDLLVTSSNQSAIHFYTTLGFAKTGHSLPYPNDPALVEHEMSLRIQ